MKHVVMTLLKNGLTRSNVSLIELKKVLYFIDQIAVTSKKTGRVVKNNNPFWAYHNRENRLRLLNDVSQMTNSLRVGGGYRILNEYENGDAYGIEKRERVALSPQEDPEVKESVIYVVFLNDGMIKGYTKEDDAAEHVRRLIQKIPKDELGYPKGCYCYRYEPLQVECELKI